MHAARSRSTAVIVIDVQRLLTEFFDRAVKPPLDRVLPHITQFPAEARRALR
jgi:hypothetical protein